MEENNVLTLTYKKLPQYQQKQIKNVLELLEQGNTVPFIARYRKELTQALDEVQIREIEEVHHYLQNLTKRKEEISRLIAEQDKLTPELENAIKLADKMQQLEDIYRPYKQKRRTKATIAKEKGLEPLANWLMLNLPNANSEQEAQNYLNEDFDILTVEDALAGARDIIAENISDTAKFREWIRHYTQNNGVIQSKVKDAEKDEKSIFEMYYDYEEKIKQIVPHRVLAINRGEKENILKVNLDIDTTAIFNYLFKQLIKNEASSTTSQIVQAYEEAYKRLIAPSIEREIRNELTQVADEQAINVFGSNLRNLLLQPPMKGRIVLGLDPAYRTGCKLAVVDETGKLLEKSVIYPHKPAPENKRLEAGNKFNALIEKHNVSMIAIGNGTASRESEQFVADQLKKINRVIHYVIVNEAGASVYSASDLARQEFPDLQVEERSAISIARRLQDPLAELVKIDPKSVGVGQYQHDVAQKRLISQLDFVVETVVNQVGVNLNTASSALLQHIAGMNKTIAQNIVTYREANGEFNNRMALKKVPRLGPKAFEQAIGFLRIIDGENSLDNTEIHPESYPSALAILNYVDLKPDEIGTEKAKERLENLSITELVGQLDIGKETVQDILKSLIKPGRDLRDDIPAPLLRSDVLKMEDLQVGMQLQGTVRNVVDFGAFVDIGVKQDGLIHLSKMSKKFVKKASDVLALGDIVNVWIDEIDLNKQRIALTMLDPQENK